MVPVPCMYTTCRIKLTISINTLNNRRKKNVCLRDVNLKIITDVETDRLLMTSVGRGSKKKNCGLRKTDGWLNNLMRAPKNCKVMNHFNS